MCCRGVAATPSPKGPCHTPSRTSLKVLRVVWTSATLGLQGVEQLVQRTPCHRACNGTATCRLSNSHDAGPLVASAMEVAAMSASLPCSSASNPWAFDHCRTKQPNLVCTPGTFKFSSLIAHHTTPPPGLNYYVNNSKRLL